MGGRAGDGDPLGMKLEGLASWIRKCVVGALTRGLRRGVFNLLYLFLISLSLLLYMFDVIEKLVHVPVIVYLLGYTLLSTNQPVILIINALVQNMTLCNPEYGLSLSQVPVSVRGPGSTHPPSAMLALRLRVHSATATLRTLRYSTSSHFMPVHPPVPRPTDWKSAAPSPPAGSTTFAAQSTLPKLPVLPLAPTLERLKVTLSPIAHSQAELADAQRKIDEFATGIGPELQRRLEEHAQYKPHWLENWWDDVAYLSYRDSVRRSSSLGQLCD
jgi:hypothetical protein